MTNPLISARFSENANKGYGGIPPWEKNCNYLKDSYLVFRNSTNLASASRFIPDQNVLSERVIIREAQVATSFPFGVTDKSILNTANSYYIQQ